MQIKKELLQHQPLLMLIRGNVLQFRIKHSRQFFLEEFQVLECKEPKEELLLRPLIMQVQQYVLICN